MQVPWGIDVGFMEVSCKFLNLVAARRPLNPTDEVFMAVPCRFVPWRFTVGFKEVPCAFCWCCLYLHLWVLSCTLTDASSRGVPWRFHAGSGELSWR